MKVDLLGLIILFAAIILSTVLHELAHGWVAYLLGDETAKDNDRLSLNPLKHIDPYMSILVPVLLYMAGGPIFGGAKPVPVNKYNLKGGAWGMALVALAGPLTNLLLGFLILLGGRIFGAIEVVNGEAMMVGEAGKIVGQVVMMELGFAVFNLLPIPPLDGSRVLYALSPDRVRDFLEEIEKYGMVIVFVLVIAGSSILSKYMVAATGWILDIFTLI